MLFPLFLLLGFAELGAVFLLAMSGMTLPLWVFGIAAVFSGATITAAFYLREKELKGTRRTRSLEETNASLAGRIPLAQATSTMMGLIESCIAANALPADSDRRKRKMVIALFDVVEQMVAIRCRHGSPTHGTDGPDMKATFGIQTRCLKSALDIARAAKLEMKVVKDHAHPSLLKEEVEWRCTAGQLSLDEPWDRELIAYALTLTPPVKLKGDPPPADQVDEACPGCGA